MIFNMLEIYEKQEILSNVQQMCATYTDPSNTVSSPPRKRDHFKGWRNSRSSASDAVDLYILMHPKDDDDILKWWSRHETDLPGLAAVARCISCIPATSTPSERCFSKASMLLTNHHSQLNLEHISDLLLIDNNYNFVSVADK
ncbi:uncharacterized protein LOC126268029 [Schistocerca gregaria]|uniref:uncharacterized protein LOC126268029 n=1 Tax=Schistocerca gregaria TaxID=7010 RepID=UPI00211F23D3|nr:uncharacterized protein LOC126268029 [Schistocerca gregaria]XP_049829408.1 uncharacterized protein LOC126268029 [Schistocerca gregaria]